MNEPVSMGAWLLIVMWAFSIYVAIHVGYVCGKEAY